MTFPFASPISRCMQPLPATLGAFLRQVLKPYRFTVAFILFSPMLMAFENNALPYALKMIVDAVMAHTGDRHTIWPKVMDAILLYVGILAGMMALFRVREWVVLKLQPKIMGEIRERLFMHTLLHSHRFFSDHFAGAIAAKVNDLARSITAMRDFICWRLVTSVSINAIAVILIATVHWSFALLVGGWIVLHLGLTRIMSGRIAAASAKNAEDRAVLSGSIVDAISNIGSVRAFARREHERTVLRRAQGREIASQRQMLVHIWWSRLITDIPMCLMYLALFFGLIHGWIQGWVSAGDMVYVLFATFLVLEQTWMLGTDFPAFISELGAAKNALSLIATPIGIRDREEAKPLAVTQGEIRYEHITFGYRDDLAPLFENVSLTVAPGEKIGLVGFSGSGKTSFVQLLMRLYDLQGGRIAIDGQDIGSVTQASLHRAIALIPQETSLFHRTLRENIAYGRPEADDAAILDAARKAGCEGFIAQLPQGLDTLVGERGVKLSGGQRQRIALARAIVKDAPILVLDEATSALDSVTEAAIQRGLAELMQGKTVLVIAHRLSTLSQMDRILVFEQGRIIEEGTHAALLARQGRYAAMWHMQAGGFLPEREQPAPGDTVEFMPEQGREREES